jgi:hypothetical protein
MDIGGTFTFGESSLAITVNPSPDAGIRADSAIVELTLHLPPNAADKPATFVPADPNRLMTHRVMCDRDPGVVALDVDVISRSDFFYYDLTANLDGHERDERCRTGGTTSLSWKTKLPPTSFSTIPKGQIYEQNFHAEVGSAGDVATQ